MKKFFTVFLFLFFLTLLYVSSGFCGQTPDNRKDNSVDIAAQSQLSLNTDQKSIQQSNDNEKQQDTDSHANNQGIKWMKYDEGMKAAKDKNLPVYIEFFATWCPPCKMLEKVTFQDQRVIKLLNDNFIAIKVDIDLESSIASQYGVRPIPHHSILNRKGELVKVMRGAMPADMFIENVKDLVK